MTKAKKKIEQILSDLRTNCFVNANSCNEFSLFELLEALVDVYKPCNVDISAFSINEVSARSFDSLIENKSVQNFRFLFDFGVQRNKMQLLNYVQSLGAEIYLTANHSKQIFITPLGDDNPVIVLIGSSNFNINNKYEANILTTNSYVVNTFYADYLKEIKSSILLND